MRTPIPGAESARAGRETLTTWDGYLGLPAVLTTSEACQHRLWDSPTGLRCTRAPHAGNGHVYHDSAGSAVADRHTDGDHG